MHVCVQWLCTHIPLSAFCKSKSSFWEFVLSFHYMGLGTKHFIHWAISLALILLILKVSILVIWLALTKYLTRWRESLLWIAVKEGCSVCVWRGRHGGGSMMAQEVLPGSQPPSPILPEWTASSGELLPLRVSQPSTIAPPLGTPCLNTCSRGGHSLLWSHSNITNLLDCMGLNCSVDPRKETLSQLYMSSENVAIVEAVPPDRSRIIVGWVSHQTLGVNTSPVTWKHFFSSEKPVSCPMPAFFNM